MSRSFLVLAHIMSTRTKITVEVALVHMIQETQETHNKTTQTSNGSGSLHQVELVFVE